jgi:hypothetical protein
VTPNQQKRAIVEALLPLCPFVQLDARRPDVGVPSDLTIEKLVFRLGRDPNVIGMPDLVIDDYGWSATISRMGVLSHVIVPWGAVNAVYLLESVACVWPIEPAGDVPAYETSDAGLRLVKGGKS